MKAADINPKKNPAFSKRLYNWCRRVGKEVKIFRQVNSDFPFYGSLYIGTTTGCVCHPNDFIGTRIASICRGSRSGLWLAMGAGFEPQPDIEEAYLRIGRCALDPAHEIQFIDERWNTRDDTRTCKWCGLAQTQRIETKIVDVVTWVSNV